MSDLISPAAARHLLDGLQSADYYRGKEHKAAPDLISLIEKLTIVTGDQGKSHMDPGFEEHQSYCNLQHGLGGRCTCVPPLPDLSDPQLGLDPEPWVSATDGQRWPRSYGFTDFNPRPEYSQTREDYPA